MICKKCGHEDLTGAAFCPKCGEKLEEAATYATPVSAAAPMPKKNTAKIIIIAAVIVALLAGAGVVTYFGFFADEPWFVEGKAADGSEEKKENKDHSEEAKAAVEEIMDGVVDYDKKIIENELDIEWFDLEALFREDVESRGDYGVVLEPSYELLLEKYFDSYEYEIGEIKEKDGKYIVPVEFSCFKGMDVVRALLSVADIDETFGTEVAQELINEGRITSSMSEEEGLSIYYQELSKEILALVEEEVRDLKIATFDLEFVVVEKDGELVVDVAESDYKELREEIESLGK